MQITEKVLLRFYASMNNELRQEANKKAFELYHKRKQHLDDGASSNRAERFHSALLDVLERYYRLIHVGKSKNKVKEIDSIKQQTKLRVKLLNSPKKQKMNKRYKILHKYGPLIYLLKEQEHLSYVKIATYLSIFHHFKIDQSYIYLLYPDIYKHMTIKKQAAYTNEYF